MAADPSHLLDYAGDDCSLPHSQAPYGRMMTGPAEIVFHVLVADTDTEAGM